MKFSIVIETATVYSDKISIEKCIQLWRNQGINSRCFFEQIVVTSNRDLDYDLDESVKIILVSDDKSNAYYYQKNIGSQHSSGDYILFVDADCIPDRNYLSSLVKLVAKKEYEIITGITYYNGSSSLAKMNTIISFGYLHSTNKIKSPSSPLSHNLIIHSNLKYSPFGKFEGRVFGDWHLSKVTQANNKSIIISKELIMNHSDPTFDLQELKDRHLREIYNKWVFKKFKVNSIKALRLVHKKRFNKLFMYGPYMGYTYIPLSFKICLNVYYLINLVWIINHILFPNKRKKWFKYQFGTILGIEIFNKKNDILSNYSNS